MMVVSLHVDHDSIMRTTEYTYYVLTTNNVYNIVHTIVDTFIVLKIYDSCNII